MNQSALVTADQPAVQIEPAARRFAVRRLVPWLLGGLALLVLAGAGAWLLLRSGNATAFATQPVRRGDLTLTVAATGNLQPTNQVDVGSELSGIITQVFVDNNDHVRQGQILARLDTSRLEDAVRQSEASLASANAAVALAEATVSESALKLQRLESLSNLSGGDAPAATDLDVARATSARATASLATAQASVKQAEAALSSNRTQLAKADIRSPVNGVVLARAVEPGQTVAASFNAPVLFTLAEDLSRMKLEVKVDEADVGQVKDGMRATFQVDAYPGRSFNAVVARLDLGATRTSTGAGQVIAYTATLLADNFDLALRPGMTATAAILVAQKRGVLLVPNAALRYRPPAAAANSGLLSLLMPRGPRSGGRSGAGAINRGSQRLIYILGEDNRPVALAVQVGASAENVSEVSGPGLAPGMRVVTGQLAQAP